MKIVSRILLVIALIAGIAAMHSAVGMPMASAHAHASDVNPVSMAMHPPEANVENPPSSRAALTDEASHGAMDHAAMHACLFLVVASLLLMLAPSIGDKLRFGMPRIVQQRWSDVALPRIDRTLELQVLRI